jgi:glycosyltransferase involved in cell wall biosynthesis
MPKVSVNIPCFNSAGFIHHTIESLLGQTYEDFEAIVIDDGSTDRTGDIIRSYRDERIRYFYQENRGLSLSRNRALSLSQGEYIAFLDHDDVWLPDKLRQQVEILDKDQDFAFVYTNYFKLKPNGKKYLGNRKTQPEGNIFENLLYYYSICLSTVMVRKQSLERLETLFDAKLCLAEETDVFMRLLFRERARYIEQPLTIYRIHPNMSSVKHVDRYPDENAYMLEKFKKMDPSFTGRYSGAIRYYEAKLGYWRARGAIAKGSAKKAREALSAYKWTDYRFFILYLSTYTSPRLWRAIHELKDKLVFGGG